MFISFFTIFQLKDVSVDMDFLALLDEIQLERPLFVKYGITLRHDDIRKGERPVVLDTDDPVTILFEFMKTKNLRLIDLLHNLDKDNSETLTRDEFRRGMEVCLYVTRLEIKCWLAHKNVCRN